MKRTVLLVLLSCPLALSCAAFPMAIGGAHTKSAKPFKARTPSEGMAVLYVYRLESVVGMGMRCPVVINGTRLAFLNIGGYVFKELPPGVATVNVTCGRLVHEEKIGLAAGASVYVQVKPLIDGLLTVQRLTEPPPGLQASREDFFNY